MNIGPKFTRFILIFASTIYLCSCGGGDSSSESQTFPEVVVNAGQDQTANEQTTVLLRGEASGVGELTYTWTANPSLTVSHPDPASTVASFEAPAVIQQTEYTLTLTATDANNQSSSDSTIITIDASNLAPLAVITVTQAPMQAPNVFPILSTIVLDGNGSSDADPFSPELPILTYEWQQLAGTNLLAMQELSDSALTLSVPILTKQENVTFSLTVTDQDGASNMAEVTLTLLSEKETTPTANAGQMQAVFSGELIMLFGSGSSVAPAATPFEFEWSTDSEHHIIINDTSIANTYAIAPFVETPTDIPFILTLTDQFGNSVVNEVLMQVSPYPINRLNDTGVTTQATNTKNFDSFQAEFPGQDGHKGADRIQASNLLEKAGRGQDGFDFTRLNQLGDEVDNISHPSRCVRDNTTGLVWENKTINNDLHDFRHQFTWFFDEDSGGFVGEPNEAGLTCDTSKSQCNTMDFVDAVNAEGLCGFFDWRLPTHNELLSIVHFGKSVGPLQDTDYFPYAGINNGEAVWYWTKQPSADGTSSDEAKNAWAIDFYTGVDNFLNKTSLNSIRLVRAGR